MLSTFNLLETKASVEKRRDAKVKHGTLTEKQGVRSVDSVWEPRQRRDAMCSPAGSIMAFIGAPGAVAPLPSRRAKRKTKPDTVWTHLATQPHSATALPIAVKSLAPTTTPVAAAATPAVAPDATAVATAKAWNCGPKNAFPHPLDPSLWTSNSANGAQTPLSLVLGGFSTPAFESPVFGASREAVVDDTDSPADAHQTGENDNDEDRFFSYDNDVQTDDSESDEKILECSIDAQLQELLGRRQIDAAVRLVREQRGRASQRSINMLLDAVGKTGAVSTVVQLFDDVAPQHDVATYCIVISTFGRRRDAASASLYFERMRRAGIRPNAFTYSALIEALGRVGRVADAERAFSAMHANGVTPNVVSYNALMKAYVKAMRLDDVFAIERQMERSGTRPDVVTCGTLINACSKAKKVDRAFDVLSRMRAEGIRPNRVCYASLIDACSKALQPERAFAVLELMRADGVQPDLYAYNTLIDACGRSRLVERAFAFYHDIVRSGVKPDHVTFNALISACGRSRDVNGAFRALQWMMNDFNYSPDLHTYNTLIDACGKAGDVTRAFEVYRRLQREKLRPCAVTYNALIDACGRAGHLDVALELLQQMRDSDVRPDCYTLNTLVHACCRYDIARAFDVVATLRDDGVNADQVTYNTLMDALKKSGRFDEAWRLFEEMVALRLRPTKVTYNSLACGCQHARDAARAKALFEHYQRDVAASGGSSGGGASRRGGVGRGKSKAAAADAAATAPTLDATTYTALVEACTRGGDITTAYRVYVDMARHGLDAGGGVAHSLAGAASRAGDLAVVDALSARTGGVLAA